MISLVVVVVFGRVHYDGRPAMGFVWIGMFDIRFGVVIRARIARPSNARADNILGSCRQPKRCAGVTLRCDGALAIERRFMLTRGQRLGNIYWAINSQDSEKPESNLAA